MMVLLRRVRRPAGALLGCLLAGPLLAQPAFESLVSEELARVTAAGAQRYQATLIVAQGNQIRLLTVTPDAVLDRDGPAQVRGAAAGTALELSVGGVPALQLNRQPWQALTDDRVDPAQLALGYHIEALPLEPVDGRPALPLKFTPVDRWRYGSTLWIDRDTGLVTKSELRSAEGHCLAQTVLTQLQLLGTDRGQAVAPAAAAMPDGNWQVQGMPAGFRMAQVLHDGNNEQILVSDGLAAASVFVEPLAPGVPGQNGVSQRGLLTSVAQVRGDFQLVVIGVLPPQTAERLLNGVTRR